LNRNPKNAKMAIEYRAGIPSANKPNANRFCIEILNWQNLTVESQLISINLNSELEFNSPRDKVFTHSKNLLKIAMMKLILTTTQRNSDKALTIETAASRFIF
jgi:hypothetical protein